MCRFEGPHIDGFTPGIVAVAYRSKTGSPVSLYGKPKNKTTYLWQPKFL